MDGDNWISCRVRLSNALLRLVDAGHELGIAAEEIALWRTVAASLEDPLMVLLSGAGGCGKSSLAGALAQGSLVLETDLDPACSPDLVMWKYGPEPMDVTDGDVLESYHPAIGLKSCEFVEVFPRARDSEADALGRAYMMSDLVLLVFSAADPWGEQQWELLGDMHRRREQPVAVVVTHAEQRTEEELHAIIEHLCQTAQRISCQEAPGFIVSTTEILAARQGASEGDALQGARGIAPLREWLGQSILQCPAVRAARGRAQSVLKAAARGVVAALEKSVGDSGAEAECIRWIDLEIERECRQALAVAAGGMTPVFEHYQEEVLQLRAKLSRKLGLLGVPQSLLQGGRWIATGRQRMADVAASAAEQGVRGSIVEMEICISTSRRRIRERVAGVFGEDVIKDPVKFEVGSLPAERLKELGRRANVRVYEAVADREEGAAIGAMLGWRRVLLWMILLGVAVGGQRVWALSLWSWRGEGFSAVLVPGALSVALLWLLVYLRGRRRRILAFYDRVMDASRVQIERGLEDIHGIEIERSRQGIPEALASLRERAAELAGNRRKCRERVAEAISCAQEL
ncbi:MAG: GTPase domain-containing protein [Verrucomicrobiales bacterium]